MKYWEKKAIDYLKESEFNHAFVTENGISYSTATIGDYTSTMQERDIAYAERAQMLAGFVKLAVMLGYSAGIGQHEGDDDSWDKAWLTVVFVDLPTGQVSWHIHLSDIPLFDWLPVYTKKWDGHSTEEKWNRVLSLPENSLSSHNQNTQL